MILCCDGVGVKSRFGPSFPSFPQQGYQRINLGKQTRYQVFAKPVLVVVVVQLVGDGLQIPDLRLLELFGQQANDVAAQVVRAVPPIPVLGDCFHGLGHSAGSLVGSLHPVGHGMQFVIGLFHKATAEVGVAVGICNGHDRYGSPWGMVA